MGKNHLEVKRDERAITMSRILNAPRARVWEAYTNPELIPQWWGQEHRPPLLIRWMSE